ncbi:hypothetical protein [Pajaroellobacter abortibovis]|uniref:Uncharacterized protein n=1 Tax=Pajaroellobacter abortibovis TaxID=1882918 RepID=A0A1L6MZ09_9BACT|nr:hypothetical protein [Pajaroellobacter abortibovis]APS00668.1 hypothetical protein BCY86_08265 [Pajaroellobacter abortibovis]
MRGFICVLGISHSQSLDADTTGQKRLTLKTMITGGEEVKSGFSTPLNWSIRLSHLVISRVALYYFSGSPLAFSPPHQEHSFLAWASSMLSVKAAHAHPGHYLPGDTLGLNPVFRRSSFLFNHPAS